MATLVSFTPFRAWMNLELRPSIQGFACSLVEAKPMQLRSHLDAFHGIFGEALLGDGHSPTETAGVKD